MKETDLLLIVDLQNDFCPGGSLPVADGDKVAKVVSNFVKNWKNPVIISLDEHPKNHCSFASNAGIPPFSTDSNGNVLWPDHCVIGTTGAEVHPDIEWIEARRTSLVIIKGLEENLDSYSAFDRQGELDLTETQLWAYFKKNKIRDLYICGLALDYCVFETALDAVQLVNQGLVNKIVLIENGTAAVTPEGGMRAIQELQKLGVDLFRG